jgi:hypothetical protein
MKNKPSLLHFICQSETTEGQQAIYLDDEQVIDALQITGMSALKKACREMRPLVFLNAAELGRPFRTLGGMGGFICSFLSMGAGGVVAPLWAMKSNVALDVAISFYTQMADEPQVPFAEILRRIRLKAYDPAIGEDTYAAYCFYGSPLATL